MAVVGNRRVREPDIMEAEKKSSCCHTIEKKLCAGNDFLGVTETGMNFRGKKRYKHLKSGKNFKFIICYRAM